MIHGVFVASTWGIYLHLEVQVSGVQGGVDCTILAASPTKLMLWPCSSLASIVDAPTPTEALTWFRCTFPLYEPLWQINKYTMCKIVMIATWQDPWSSLTLTTQNVLTCWQTITAQQAAATMSKQALRIFSWTGTAYLQLTFVQQHWPIYVGWIKQTISSTSLNNSTPLNKPIWGCWIYLGWCL